MILRRADGNYEAYNIGTNAILGEYRLGQVGTDGQGAPIVTVGDSIPHWPPRPGVPPAFFNL